LWFGGHRGKQLQPEIAGIPRMIAGKVTGVILG
jgi:hypothetical protein